MTLPNESKSLSVSIACSFTQAYNFLSLPENFTCWASRLAGSLQRIDGAWVTETVEGPMAIRFSEPNELGILDHWVYPKLDVPIYVPMRLVANSGGCTLIVTIFRRPEVSNEAFTADADLIMGDLTALKNLLERAAYPVDGFQESRDFFCQEIVTDNYLLTYTLHHGVRITRRANIWRWGGGGWVIVYHQGTIDVEV